MASHLRKLQYPLAFIVGTLAYSASNFAAAFLQLYHYFPYAPADFHGPAYIWWIYDAFNYLGVYYQFVLYGVAFWLFCLGMQALGGQKLPGKRIALAAAAATLLMVISVFVSFPLDDVLDPHFSNPTAQNILDTIVFALIGGWFALAWWAVQRSGRTHR